MLARGPTLARATRATLGEKLAPALLLVSVVGCGGANHTSDAGPAEAESEGGKTASVASGGADGGGSSAGHGGSLATAGAGDSITVAAAGACASSGIAVYTDAMSSLQLGWKGHGTFKENPSGGCEGSKSYEYDWNVQTFWDGFLLNLPEPIDASKATAFTYAYKQGPSDPNFFFVRLHSGNEACGAGCDEEVHASSPDWKVVTIPISKYVESGEVDLTSITAIEFGFSGPDASGTFQLDDMVFTH